MTQSTIVISHVQTQALAPHRGAHTTRVAVSPDLGLTTVQTQVESTGFRFPGGEILTWEAIDAINKAENNCFLLRNGEIHKIAVFSESTNRVYSLMATQGAPTMLVSGIPMHRIKGTDPWQDTQEKIKALRAATGYILDTTTGLGYTAMMAAKTAEHVTTVELDPAALEIARNNPWSRDLFDNSKITQRIGDSFDVIQEFEAAAFTCIIHDPPMFKLAGDLYSRDFYREAYRVLRRGGQMFHYIGDPESHSGRNVTRGVVRRLYEAGFSHVLERPRAFGVVAVKER